MTKVFIKEGQAVTDSKLIADEFGKRHDSVIRTIESLECSKDFTDHNFVVSEYTDSTGRKLKKFDLTYDGFVFVAMGFTGKKAAKLKEEYINEFNRVKKALEEKSEDFMEITDKARQKDITLKEINEIRFSEKRTIGTFENTKPEDTANVFNDFIEHVQQLHAKTRIVRCKSAIAGLTRLEDRMIKENPVKHFGDCYNVQQYIIKLKDIWHNAENKHNGGVKSAQVREINRLKEEIA
ncbi:MULTISPECIES: Rha family transcriptional regulator [Bacillus]|uniref:Rha family transcriptional regulator n=1 Tax=Bacillus TaxID=1386 RepID=UPI0006F94736|nr:MULTISPECIES: Rha family transcriptional regulator [Bacillus]KQU11571.1 hypothetical protein ASG46_10225 [Bacillus sp. Leaf49]